MTDNLTPEQTRALDQVHRAHTLVTRSGDLHKKRLRERAARLSAALEAGVSPKVIQEETGLSPSTIKAAVKTHQESDDHAEAQEAEARSA